MPCLDVRPINDSIYRTNIVHVQLGAVSVLLEKNAKVDVKSNDGNNPLLMASYNGQLDMVKELLKQVCRMM